MRLHSFYLCCWDVVRLYVLSFSVTASLVVAVAIELLDLLDRRDDLLDVVRDLHEDVLGRLLEGSIAFDALRLGAEVDNVLKQLLELLLVLAVLHLLEEGRLLVLEALDRLGHLLVLRLARREEPVRPLYDPLGVTLEGEDFVSHLATLGVLIEHDSEDGLLLLLELNGHLGEV